MSDLTLAAAAESCSDKTYKTVHRAILNGELKAYRHGRQWRIKPSELEIYKQRREYRAPQNDRIEKLLPQSITGKP